MLGGGYIFHTTGGELKICEEVGASRCIKACAMLNTFGVPTTPLSLGLALSMLNYNRINHARPVVVYFHK